MTAEPTTRPMTIGQLSRRTGATIKALRLYTDWGLISTVGRSPAGYRLYRTDAEWCVRLIDQMRGLGLTVAEIRELAHSTAGDPARLGPELAARLRTARDRIDARIADLERTRRRIDAFEAVHQDELTSASGFWWSGGSGYPRCPQATA